MEDQSNHQHLQSDCESKSDAGRSEIEETAHAHPSTGKTDFKLSEIVEMLFSIGMTSYLMWERVLTNFGKSFEVQTDPLLLQIYMILKQLSAAFGSFIHENCDPSQYKLPLLMEEEKSLKELLSILNPLLKKKSFKEKLFSHNVVNKLMILIRNALQPDETVVSQKKRKAKKVKKSVKKSKKHVSKKHSSSSSSSDSSSSGSSSSSSDSEEEFGKLFKDKSKNKIPYVSQQFIFVTGKDLKQRIVTPGEQGSHLIKIEITDTRDLKKCQSDKYWQKVHKKGYFLLNNKNDEDKAILSQLDSILVEACKRVKETIPNLKKDKFKLGSYAKKN